MAIVINGSGTVTGLAVGGLPDGTVDAGTVAADVATQAEIDAKLNLAGGALTGALTTNSTIDGVDVAAVGALATNSVQKSGGSVITSNLDFNDNVIAKFGTGGDLQVYHDGSHSYLDSATGQLYINSDGNVIIRNSADSELARLDTYGRLLVGTTSTADVNYSGLSVRADHYGSFVAKFAHRKSNGDGAGILIDIENSQASAVNLMRFNVLSGTIGTITGSTSATSYNTSSDYRLKENVDYSWDATTKLKQLKPARFNFIVDDTNTLVDGFLAHEVSSIVPEAITGTKDETKDLTNVVLKSNGVVITSDVTEAEWTQGKTDDEYPSDSTWAATHTENIYQSIDQSKLVPLLVKTIQELEARITALEA